MIISVVNKKGGVGKTPIAFSLAKDLGMKLQSNDNSVIESIYPGMAQVVEKVSVQDDTVYDFGGFVSTGIVDIIRASNAVIVPCSVDYNSILRTVETIEEIQSYNQNIIVIVTKTEKEDDFHSVMHHIEEHFNDLYYFELRNSKIFKNSMEWGSSITELYNQTPLSKSAYKTVYQQYNTVLDLFKTS